MRSYEYTKEDLQSSLIPADTMAKARIKVIPGEYSDPSKGITKGWATRSENTGSIFYKTKFEILDTFKTEMNPMKQAVELKNFGKYVGMNLYHMIGIESPKGPLWGDMGFKFIKDIIHSARDIKPKDMSEEANKKRQPQGDCDAEDINGETVAILIGIKVGHTPMDDDKNFIKKIITPENPFYKQIMGKEMIPQASSIAFDDDVPF